MSFFGSDSSVVKDLNRILATGSLPEVHGLKSEFEEDGIRYERLVLRHQRGYHQTIYMLLVLQHNGYGGRIPYAIETRSESDFDEVGRSKPENTIVRVGGGMIHLSDGTFHDRKTATKNHFPVSELHEDLKEILFPSSG